jgi:hypothetical protein
MSAILDYSSPEDRGFETQNAAPEGAVDNRGAGGMPEGIP